MVTNKEVLKITLHQAIANELTERRLKDYDVIAKRITEEEYFIFFEVMESHYLANGIMNLYLEDMYWKVKDIMQYLYYNQDMTNAEVMANVFVLTHDSIFDKEEIKEIGEELIQRINGSSYHLKK